MMPALLRPLMLSLLMLSAPLHASERSKTADEAAVKSVLGQYKQALERLDLTGVDTLFAPQNTVVESGKVEGGYADYLANHIGPELDHFRTFEFSDYAVDVRIEGDTALATETYRYTIELKDKPEPIVRQGVATSALKRSGDTWQILSMHSSSRTPKAAATSSKK